MGRETKGQDVTPGVGTEGNFFGDFFIPQNELDGIENTEDSDAAEGSDEQNDDAEQNQDNTGAEEDEAEGEETGSDDASTDDTGDEDASDADTSDEGGDSDEDEEADQSSGNSDSETVNYGDTMTSLVEEGILDIVDPEKEFTPDAKGIAELVKDTVAKRLQDANKEANEGRHEDVVALETFLKENPGATHNDFVTEQEAPDYNTVDETDPQTMVYLLEDMYGLQGLSQEEIAENIKEHKASKSLGRHAKRAKGVLVKYQAQNDKAKTQARQAAQAQQEAERVENRRQFEQKVLKSSKIGGISVTPEERQGLADYILKPVDEAGNTQLMLDEANDQDSALLYAYIRQRKLDLSKIERKAETKATIKFKGKLNKKTDPNAKARKTKANPTRDAAEGDLSGLDSWTFGKQNN